MTDQLPEVPMRDLPVTLPSLSVAIVRVPAVMSEEDYQSLLGFFMSWKKSLVIPHPVNDPAAIAIIEAAAHQEPGR